MLNSRRKRYFFSAFFNSPVICQLVQFFFFHKNVVFHDSLSLKLLLFSSLLRHFIFLSNCYLFKKCEESLIYNLLLDNQYLHYIFLRWTILVDIRLITVWTQSFRIALSSFRLWIFMIICCIASLFWIVWPMMIKFGQNVELNDI